MDSWRRIAVCVGQALLYQQFGDLFAVARRFRAFAEHQAFGHSQTAEAASFQRALFTPGADEFLGPPHALAAQMRLHASRRVPPMAVDVETRELWRLGPDRISAPQTLRAN